MFKFCLTVIFISAILCSCEEVINIDLNSANPVFVVEGKIYQDSTCLVRLTMTTSYFSPVLPQVIENASITLSDGISMEELVYEGNGYYSGNSIIGTEGRNYTLEIVHDGIIYESNSFMPQKTTLTSIRYTKSQSPTILNPYGETVFAITCKFADNPANDSFYMIRIIADGTMAEDSYYLLTEEKANDGIFNNTDNLISFTESIFFDGGEVDVQLFAIDESVYNYFLQLNDILFWKRRVMPPTPYNPVSNITNGALGYFAAWTFDSETVILE
jgi:hypothetical protein